MSYRVISKKGHSIKDFMSVDEANAEANKMTRRTGIYHSIIQNPSWYDNINNYSEEYCEDNSYEEIKSKQKNEHLWKILKIEIDILSENIKKTNFNFNDKNEIIKFWRNNGVYYNSYMDTTICGRRGYKQEIMLGSTLIILIQTKIY